LARIVRLRCLTCGSRSEVTLGDLETRELRTQRQINRSCKICRGVTRHEVTSTVDSFGDASSSFRGEAESPFSSLSFTEEDDAPRLRALIIEDDESARAVLSKALQAAHFDTVAVGDGREALRILSREDFAVILSDINMPELDGKKLFEFLEQNLPEARSRVIFITGETGNEATRDFLEATGQPYLPKPVELPLLFVLLEAVAAGNS
jgi:CheY-like chemotaxis protein